MRQLFYRGRHHVHTAPRPADGRPVTVSTIAARLRGESRMAATLGVGQYVIHVSPHTIGFSAETKRALAEMTTA